MVSQTAEYALRAVLYLAERGDTVPVRVGDMARALGIPQNYLSKTLHALVHTGVLASVRGPQGGFLLARPASQLPLAAVVAPFGDITGRRQCLLGRPQCRDHGACAAHSAWKRTSEQVATFFRTTTIGDLRPHAAVPTTTRSSTRRPR
jgi:Rrf2 family iron-sulfur cluster assembly transcriptional regulator